MMKPNSNILAFVEYLLISLFLFSLRKMGLNNGCDRIRLSKRLFLQIKYYNCQKQTFILQKSTP